MSVNVSYNNGEIKIVSPKGTITKKTTDFYELGIDKKNCEKNSNDSFFTREQKDLRALDCMKDGKVGKYNISGNVYGILYGNDIEKRVFDTLHTIEEKHTNCSKSKIKKYAWTKVSKESSLEPKFSKRIIFKESGLDTEYFIDKPNFCGNFANEIIDPAGRSPIDIQKGDIIFPLNNNKLVLEESFLTFFGFIGCSVEATRIKQKEYNYNINIKGLNTIQKSTTDDNGIRVNWFQGNNEKNMFILNDKDLSKLSNSRAIKNGLLLTKEMGDVLQVLIMLIWSLLNTGESYAMGTCDKVVFLQCMLLNLNCILTSAVKGSGEGPVKTGKVRSIEYYEPKEYTLEDATLRFNTEKENILKDNNQFIILLTLLQNADPGIPIFISGVNEPYIFTGKFYKMIINDLTNINELLKQMTINNLNTPDLIDNQLKKMKENFVFKIFIRPINNTFKMILDKTYTHKNELWKKDISLELNNSGSSFFEFGKRNKEFIVEIEDTNKKRKRGGKKYSINKGGESYVEEYKNFLKKYEYEDTAYYHDEEYYDVLENNEKEKDINLYKELHEEVKKILFNLEKQDYFHDVIHLLYYHFYFENEVFYDIQLSNLIEEIINTELDTIQRVMPENYEMSNKTKKQRIETVFNFGGKKNKKAKKNTKTRKYKKKI